MATALHSRYLLTTDLDEHFEDATDQKKLSDNASGLGLSEERELYSGNLDLTFTGAADAVARLLERCNGREQRLAVCADTEEEREVLLRRIGDITEVNGPI